MIYSINVEYIWEWNIFLCLTATPRKVFTHCYSYNIVWNLCVNSKSCEHALKYFHLRSVVAVNGFPLFQYIFLLFIYHNDFTHCVRLLFVNIYLVFNKTQCLTWNSYIYRDIQFQCINDICCVCVFSNINMALEISLLRLGLSYWLRLRHWSYNMCCVF
jgi:hypothetical protein